MCTMRLFRSVAISLVCCLCLAGFAVAADTSVTLNGTSKTFQYNGASGSIGFTLSGAPRELVTVDAAVVDASWITIDPRYLSRSYKLNAFGRARGSILYRVARYEASSPSPRQGTITVGGSPFTVYQNGMPCTVSIKPPQTSFTGDGGTATIQVTAPLGCGWNASADPAVTWITFPGEVSGSGSGILSYEVNANFSGKARTGKVYVTPAVPKGAKKTHTVSQKAATSPSISSQYVVFAWNDLGMHCLNPTYDDTVILPPYNTVWAQVVRKGNPPEIVTDGLQIDYRIINNTFSYGKRSYGQFWDNMLPLFGTTLPHDKGLNLDDPTVNNGLSGTMLAKGDHFQVSGIPVTPVLDGGVWNPYQVAEVTVRDKATGQVLAQTRATVPTSDEIHCDGCHGAGVAPILEVHDELSPLPGGEKLVDQRPVLCAKCHASPALASPGQAGRKYLSQSIHSFHGSLPAGEQPTCYSCHPGQSSICNRSLRHTAPDGNCVTCHGTLAEVGSSIAAGRIPWVNEPACSDCHGGTAIPQVNTGATLYRNAAGHGGMRCSACHGSPHAMVPSREASDNYQALAYQGKAVSIGSCGACHESSRGEGLDEFAEAHGGSNPEHRNACHICHTVVPLTPTLWPHGFKWIAR